MSEIPLLRTKKEAKLISNFINSKFPGGEFKPEDIVELARPPKSPIHKYFEWNDTKAAHLYRIQQARKLIQCLVVEIDGGEIREFHSVLVNGDKDRSYVSFEKTRAEESLYAQVLESAMNRAIYWKEQYKHLKELSSITEAISYTERTIYEKNKGKNNKGTSRKNHKHSGGSVQARQSNASG